MFFRFNPRVKDIIFICFCLIVAIKNLSAANNPTPSKEDTMTFDYLSQNEVFWNKHLDKATNAVCRHSGTEAAGSGEYNKFYKDGTYFCACCGGDHPVFDSKAKYDSKTGWPSFTAAISRGIIERPDPNDKIRGFFGKSRTEVICSRCHSHLGHVFDDGPEPTGKRYCMNSIALRFTPRDHLPQRTYEVEGKN